MGRRSIWISLLVAVLAASMVSGVARSRAVSPGEALVKVGESGSGAGQLNLPEGANNDLTSGVATNPTNGHILVVDGENNRVDEFTPWGSFIKAFGWDVAPAGVNEQQEVTVKATAGQFTLSFGASTTPNLEFNASAATVQSALNALTSISAGGGAVTVKAGASDSSSSRYVVSFTASPLKEADVEQLVGADVSLGGGSSTGVTVATRADGTVSTTGLESCTAESGCQAGNGAGTGAGQISFVAGIAVAANGDIYVRNFGVIPSRVQIFDSAGRFVAMFGGEVNKTTNADICTAASGDTCGAGVPGTGPGEFSAGNGIAIGPNGRVFVADKERIEEFEPDGTYLASIAIPGQTVRQMAIDPTSGDFFATYGQAGAKVHKLSPAGSELCLFPAFPEEGSPPEQSSTNAIATGPDGTLYVSSQIFSSFQGYHELILEFDGSCPASLVSVLSVSEPPQNAIALGTNTAGDLLVPRSGGGLDYVQIYGPPPVLFEPPPQVPPTIGTQFLLSASDHQATVKAKINPNFWADTSYYVEYGTGECSTGGCTSKEPLTPSLLGAGVVRTLVNTAGVELAGLVPHTTYHYRFVAQSSGGGPVFGLDPDGEGSEEASFEDGLEGTFTTLRTPEGPDGGCPNQVFRIESSASLPDCRAFEMVSPVDKENGDALALIQAAGFESRLDQTALNGEALTYSSYRAFPNSQAAPYTSQYIARRGGGGWVSESLAAPRGGPGVFNSFGFTENDFKSFSADLCQAWQIFDAEPALAPGAVERFPNLYRRQNCTLPVSYEALTTVTPPEPLPHEFGSLNTPELQGHSADGSVAVFRAEWKMSADAAGGGTFQVYEARGGELKLVCILPSETALGSACSAGGDGDSYFSGRGMSVSHAVSADGSVIYWTAAPYEAPAGKIYLRRNGSETLKVSEAEGAGKTTLKAQFLGASESGSSALYTVSEGAKKEKLYLYSLGSEESSEIASQVMGIAGSSEDLSYVYFISKEVIGGEGIAGQPNLYLWHEGTRKLVATLAGADVRVKGVGGDRGAFSDVAPQAVYHVAKATPDGRHLTFISAKALTGSDNTDANSGEADEEVFRYDAVSGEVNCASCSPVGARPAGREVEVPAGGTQWTAAMIPGGETQLFTPRALSDNGNRLFFTSYTDLLPADTNAKADVYEWEAPGEGACSEAKAAFSEANAGCLYLISTGSSSEDSELLDSTPSGSDVFFLTEQSILRQDPGLIDVYDARVGGGFAQPAAPVPCDPSSGACQNPAGPPSSQNPSFPSGEGNPPIKCPKGKHKVTKNGKTSCAKNKKKNSHHKKSKKKPHKARRAGR